MTYKIVSLFSGCGGFDLGAKGGFDYLGKHFAKNNVEIVRANDIWQDACDTYKYNLGSHIFCEDVSNIASSEIPDCDIILGGFPCQDFSVAGKRRGTDSERGNLYLQMKRIVNEKRPKLFIAENVKGILSINDGNTIKQIIKEFVECGYNVNYHLLKAIEYGVPQTRERVIIVGVRQDLGVCYDLPPEKALYSLNAGDAIDDLWGLETKNSFHNHSQYSQAKRNKGQGNSIISKSQPGPTIRAEHHGNIEFHYNETRRLTVRECARLQSFPDDFIFVKSGSSNYKQVGNAVPPVLGWHIIKDVIDKVLYNNEVITSHKLYQENLTFHNTF